jgi:hypothetical protein
MYSEMIKILLKENKNLTESRVFFFLSFHNDFCVIIKSPKRQFGI